MLKGHKQSLKTLDYRKHAIAGAFIVIIAFIGIHVLTSSHASGAYTSVEASTGTLAGSATSATDGNASDGSYVRFGSSNVSTGTGTGCTNDDGSSTTCSGGCSSSGIVAPCIGSSTTGGSGWGTPSFDEEFNGNSINTTVWNTENGWNKNDITVSSSDESESGGDLFLTLSSNTTGAEISTNVYALPVGGFAEARIDFPGSGTTVYNWPAWWSSGPNWPSSGENDIMEAANGGNATVNYHYTCGSSDCQVDSYTIAPSLSSTGTWANGYHIFGLYRGSNYADVYYDGSLVDSYATDDNGAGESLILTNGCYDNSGCTTPATMEVDYVRAWNTNTNTNSSHNWSGSTVCTNTSGCH